MDKFQEFSKAIGLKVNPSKFILYGGGIDDKTKKNVGMDKVCRRTTTFSILGDPIELQEANKPSM